jgi:hypothetical protein
MWQPLGQRLRIQRIVRLVVKEARGQTGQTMETHAEGQHQ